MNNRIIQGFVLLFWIALTLGAADAKDKHILFFDRMMEPDIRDCIKNPEDIKCVDYLNELQVKEVNASKESFANAKDAL